MTDADVVKVVSAIQIQVNRDLYKAWRIRANILALKKGETGPLRSWIIVITDDASQADQGVLGYHSESSGIPIGFVFPSLDAKYGLYWGTTLSHEVVEALVDPFCNYTVLQQTGQGSGRLVPVEVGDPVESDDDGYLINDVRVSDFVFPSWYDSTLAPGSTQFDQTGKVTAPFQVAPKGYLSVLPVTWSGTWQDVGQRQGKPGGTDPDERGRKRFLPRAQWRPPTT